MKKSAGWHPHSQSLDIYGLAFKEIRMMNLFIQMAKKLNISTGMMVNQVVAMEVKRRIACKYGLTMNITMLIVLMKYHLYAQKVC